MPMHIPEMEKKKRHDIYVTKPNAISDEFSTK